MGSVHNLILERALLVDEQSGKAINFCERKSSESRKFIPDVCVLEKEEKFVTNAKKPQRRLTF